MVDDIAAYFHCSTELASKAKAQRGLDVVVPLLCGRVVYPPFHSWNDEPIVAGGGKIPVLIHHP